MGPEWIVVGIVAVAVLFGAKKIPEIARGVGRAQGEFKKGLKEGVVDDGSGAGETQAQPSEQSAPSETQQQQPTQAPRQPGTNGSGSPQA